MRFLKVSVKAVRCRKWGSCCAGLWKKTGWRQPTTFPVWPDERGFNLPRESIGPREFVLYELNGTARRYGTVIGMLSEMLVSESHGLSLDFPNLPVQSPALGFLGLAPQRSEG
jgi:hypothetical protein